MLNLINQITQDEDERQDLWVAYLSGLSLSSFSDILKYNNSIKHIEENFKHSIQVLIDNPLSQDFISCLTKNECIIVCLLMLGCDLGIISQYNGISEARINHIMVVLKDSEAWDKLWH